MGVREVDVATTRAAHGSRWHTAVILESLTNVVSSCRLKLNHWSLLETKRLTAPQK